MEKILKYADVWALVCALALLRLIMGIPNFEPIGALALFGGSVIISRRWAFLIPLLALLAGDLIMAAWNSTYAAYMLNGSFLWVYGSFAAVVLIGRYLIGDQRSGLRIFRAAILSSVVFFLVTNFGTWANGMMYSMDWSGLMQCYLAGLVFYKQDFLGSFFLNSILSTVGFSFLAFGLYRMVHRIPASLEQTT